MAEIHHLPRRHKKAGCPVCKKPAVETFRPFCSKRCQQIDLGRWLGGNYALPTEEEPDEADIEALARQMMESGRPDGEG